MADGLEPATSWTTTRCSTSELQPPSRRREGNGEVWHYPRAWKLDCPHGGGVRRSGRSRNRVQRSCQRVGVARVGVHEGDLRVPSGRVHAIEEELLVVAHVADAGRDEDLHSPHFHAGQQLGLSPQPRAWKVSLTDAGCRAERSRRRETGAVEEDQRDLTVRVDLSTWRWIADGTPLRSWTWRMAAWRWRVSTVV